MAEDTQAVTTDTTQAVTTEETAQAQATVTQDTTQAAGSVAIEDLQRQLKETREEAARYRVKAKQFEDAQKEAERAKLDESERLKLEAEDARKEAQEATDKAKTRLLKAAVISEAAKLGVVDPEAAFMLLDRAKVTFDEDGEPQNVEKLVKALVQEKQYLIGSGSSAANIARDTTKETAPDKPLTGADAMWGSRRS